MEAQYSRYTPAALKLITRRHVVLSNQFKLWLGQMFNIPVFQEHDQIDATFEASGKRFLVEFKIAYGGDTKSAIREALGQILEYNHYPPRVSHDHWLLILDTAPSKSDMMFADALREEFQLPLNLGWLADSVFQFEKPLGI